MIYYKRVVFIILLLLLKLDFNYSQCNSEDKYYSYLNKLGQNVPFSESASSFLNCYDYFYNEKNYPFAVYSLNFAAFCYINIERHDEAKTLVDLAFSKLEETDYHSEELLTDLYFLYALIYFDFGNPELSIYYAEKSIHNYNLHKRTNYGHYIMYQNLGYCHLIIGDYDKSVINFKEALKLASNPTHSLNTQLMSSMSQAFLENKDIENAKYYLDLSLENVYKSHDEYDQIYFYEELSSYFIEINELDSAQYYLTKANKLDPNFHEQVNLLQIQGKLNLMRNSDLARSNYTDAIRISTDSLQFNKFKTSQVYLNAAKSHKDNNQNEIAINYLNNSITSVWQDYEIDNDYSKILNHRLVSEALILKSILLAKENRLIESKESFETSLSVIKYLLKSKITSWDSATNFSSQIKSHYSDLITEATRIKDFDFAFKINQSIHAILLSLKLDDIKAREQFGLNEMHTEKITKLKIDISKQNTSLLNVDESTLSKDSLERAIFYKQRSLDSLIKIFENSNPAYYKLKYAESKNITPENIQHNFLSNESAVIEYFMSETYLYTFIISKQNLHVLSTEIDSNFISEIDILNKSIRSLDGDFDQFTSSSTYLYKHILKDALEHLGPSVNKLYIIPDNEINYIPFEVLLKSVPESAQNSRYDLLPYLVNDYSISHHYSSTLLNNDNTSLSKNITSFAPSFTSPFYSEKNLESLLFNRDEIMIINDITDGQINIDSSANIENLKKDVNEYRIAHLATHATCNDSLPFESKIYFEDGPIHAYEIYNMPHKLDLAVLSACQTGTGVLKKGEGLMSLARAFISSGCKSVITSLWNVNDKNSLPIMEHFYKYLYDGHAVGESLTNAKRDYLKNVNSVWEAHPYHWATFITIGNADMAISTFPWYLIILSFFTILILLYFIAKNKSSENFNSKSVN